MGASFIDAAFSRGTTFMAADCTGAIFDGYEHLRCPSSTQGAGVRAQQPPPGSAGKGGGAGGAAGPFGSNSAMNALWTMFQGGLG